MRRLLILFLCLFALSLVGSCRSAGIKRAYMALDRDGKRKRDVFFTDSEAIVCVAEVASGRDDLTVTAVLRSTAEYSPVDGSVTPIHRFRASEEEDPGAGEDIVVSFSYELADGDLPFPAGLFVCDLYLDGELEESVDFEIRYPPCPIVPLYSGVLCGGFVIQGSQCPGAVLGVRCTCTEAGQWECA